MTKKRKPTLKMYKYRLRVMLSQDITLKYSCPMMRGWWNKKGTGELWTEKPCYICRQFMEVTTNVCPCFYYEDCEEAKAFALNKLNKMEV